MIASNPLLLSPVVMQYAVDIQGQEISNDFFELCNSSLTITGLNGKAQFLRPSAP